MGERSQCRCGVVAAHRSVDEVVTAPGEAVKQQYEPGTRPRDQRDAKSGETAIGIRAHVGNIGLDQRELECNCALSCTAVVDRRGRDYLMASYTWNIGRYIARIMKPTMVPTTTIMIGSRIEVRDLTAASTCS